MARATFIDQPLAQHHVAAAFPMNGPGFGEGGKPTLECRCGSKRARMKFGIASRQPARIATLVRPFIRERREGKQLDASRPPVRNEMGIEEGEGRILCHRDAIARRRQGCVAQIVGDERRLCQRKDRIKIEMLFRKIGQSFEPCGEIVMFARLHEAEMPLG